MTEINKLVNFFIKNNKNFYQDFETLNLDSKHKKILKNFYNNFESNKLFFDKYFRNWTCQSDLGSPAQLTLDHLKIQGISSIFKFFKEKIFFLRYKNFKNSFLDDLELLKLSGGQDILRSNPVHLTPGCYDFYKIFNTSTNSRWTRYAYIANNIIKYNLLKNNSLWLDIGSYYGGLQSFIKKKLPDINIFLLDFNHQLCRSYIFLKQLFPNSNHILPDDILTYKFEKIKDTFFYVPIEDFEKLPLLKFDLVSNFFSFGEMKIATYNNYINNKNFKNSRYIYLVNRFVSSPCFEKTYDSDLTIFDYNFLDRNRLLFDIFPIHVYNNIKRKLFNRNCYRPVSSQYFEMILKKNI
jgi:putative sugar O-methyltransferase